MATDRKANGPQDQRNNKEAPNRHQDLGQEPEETLETILDGLSETVLEISDEDLLSAIREQGRQPNKEAEEVRRILFDAIDSFKKKQDQQC